MLGVEIRIDDFLLSADLQLSFIEPLTWEVQDRFVRAIVLQKLDVSVVS